MTGRLASAAFVLLCVAGSGTAVALTVHEALRTPAVVTDVTGTTRVGLVTTVHVAVRNTTGRARCAAVRVVARDRGGHDLAAAEANRALRLPPHGRVRLTARLTLTARQYAERLEAFYPSARPCRSAG